MGKHKTIKQRPVFVVDSLLEFYLILFCNFVYHLTNNTFCQHYISLLSLNLNLYSAITMVQHVGVYVYFIVLFFYPFKCIIVRDSL